MTITEQDIKNLTPEHRIVWHESPGQPVEMGMYVDEDGHLCTDIGHLVCRKNGWVPTFTLQRIVRIIEPAFTPRVGMFIGKPGSPDRTMVRRKRGWLGYAPEIDDTVHWFSDLDARALVEEHGWKVVDDLASPGEVTDAEVTVAAKALATHPGVRQNLWFTVARAALEAAREVRND